MSLGPVLIGIEGTTLSPRSRDMLCHPLVGGVVLFQRNFANRGQLCVLVSEIRELRDPRLLLAVDQEGGRVQRFVEGFTRLPALGRIGQVFASDPQGAMEVAYWHGQLMACEMLEVGIDLSFAPVIDLDRGSDVIGDRAFSADPEVVIALGRAYLEGMHAAGMKTTGKHFPGHGSVRADSHVSDVCDQRELEDIEASDLKPFATLAENLDAMMIAHVVYPALDDRPAGYSRPWLIDQLRGRIGFEGVIFSDDLGMHAARVEGDLRERTLVALAAGCDAALVCLPNDVDALLTAWAGRTAPDVSDVLSRLYGSPGAGLSAKARAACRSRLERLCR